MTAIQDACLNRSRIDTHGHLTDSCPPLQCCMLPDGRFGHAAQLTESRVFAEGCRVLYGADAGVFLRPDSAASLQGRAADLRKGGGWGAVQAALDKSRIDQQLVFCSFNPKGDHPFSGEATHGRIHYLAQVDRAINGDGGFPTPDYPHMGEPYYQRLCTQFGELGSLGAYLEKLEHVVDGLRARGVVGVKTSMAYTTGLLVSDPDEAGARAAFSRKNDMTLDDFRTVRDYAFRHVLQACRKHALPIVIHTGFPIWGHANLSQTNPLLLHNLLADARYRDLTFVLLHGGNPYTGETTYLAGTFPNVIIDFTWIGWMTPARFKPALAEWLSIVPHDRICWGADSNSPESIAGIDSIMRRLIAEVLDEAVQDRLIDEQYALEFVEHAYCNTPRRIFGI